MTVQGFRDKAHPFGLLEGLLGTLDLGFRIREKAKSFLKYPSVNPKL